MSHWKMSQLLSRPSTALHDEGDDYLIDGPPTRDQENNMRSYGHVVPAPQVECASPLSFAPHVGPQGVPTALWKRSLSSNGSTMLPIPARTRSPPEAEQTFSAWPWFRALAISDNSHDLRISADRLGGDNLAALTDCHADHQLCLDEELLYLINQLPFLEQENGIQSRLTPRSPANYEASLTGSGSQSSTPDSDAALTPNLHTCPYCLAKFSLQALNKHRLAHVPTFPCRLDNEPGCRESFKTEKDQYRHWHESCKVAGKLLPPYGCCCGKGVKRWDRFKKHIGQCPSAKHQLGGNPHRCYCGAQFETWVEMKAHHESTHQKSPGRPRKSNTARTRNVRGTEVSFKSSCPPSR
ncbi:hypothetical protein EDB81DRAFT_858344 [Dactylonectria macrodidyma]|uniref:Uncharacterized protein n=1 Tax=Dactylonectria macrodidyma TaxID=307937 RepID=A0A9P9ED99_9HYPO|nr:hypothetical protein EDB81DRAFT_858344 [Dactylonectria macrodidyma]